MNSEASNVGTPIGIPATELQFPTNRESVEVERPSSMFWRQLDIVKLEDLQKQEVTLIGAGSVGSFVALTLTKMGINKLKVYDFDKIEEYNIPNQFYKLNDLDKAKVDALKETIKDFSDVDIEIVNKKYEGEELSGIVIAAVDTMEVRSLLWKKCKFNMKVQLFIDARMSAKVYRLYSIRPTDIDGITLYEATLHSDKDAAPERCTEKTIIYTVLGLSADICNVVKKYTNGEVIPKEIIKDFDTMQILVNE